MCVRAVCGTLQYAFNSERTDEAEETLFRHLAGYVVTGGGGGISLSFYRFSPSPRAKGEASAAAPIIGPLISALRRAAFAECYLLCADGTKTRAGSSSLAQRTKMCSRHTVVPAYNKIQHYRQKKIFYYHHVISERY